MAAIDAFGRSPMAVGSAMAADSAVDLLGGAGLPAGPGLLVQQLQTQYQQPINRIYELGSNLVYYVAGRQQGNGSISRVIGPVPVTVAFYAIYGNVCNAGENNLFVLAAGACFTNPAGRFSAAAEALRQGSAVGMLFTGVVLNTIGMSIRSEDMLIGEQLGLMFVAEQLVTGDLGELGAAVSALANFDDFAEGGGDFGNDDGGGGSF